MVMAPRDYEALGLLAPLHRVNPPDGPADMAHLLDAALASTPDALALVGPDGQYSYAALESAVTKWASAMAARGIGPGVAVAASLSNGCAIVIAFLATQRLGAIWVGINTVLANREKVFILGHSGVKLFLAEAADLTNLAPILTEHACHGIAPDSAEWQSELAAAPPPPTVTIDAFAPAAIMYTSGTTGQPKGVVHSQHNFVTVCAALTAAGTIRPHGNRAVVQPLTITNVMVLGPVLTLRNGKTVFTRPMPRPALLCAWLMETRPQSCIVAPTTVYDILEQGLDLPDGLELASGGAPIPTPIRQRFIQRFGYPLVGTYGLTEAPTIVTDTRGVEPPVGSSGKVLPHLRLAILDEQGRELPPGEIGSLCFGPVTHGPWAHVYTPPLGYWHNPDKTAELLADGLVHSGDMGHVDADGWLFVADRASELILRAASNIYPAEVERVLYEHMGVAACALIGKPDERLGKRTVAFVQAREPDADTEQLQAELTDMCRQALARYKLPDEWRFVEGFDRNAMGKIVRPRLIAMLEAELRG